MTTVRDTEVVGMLRADSGARTMRYRRFNVAGGIVTVATVIAAVLWAFPLYWGVVTTLKPEYEVVQPGIGLWPKELTFDAYLFALVNTKIGLWYLNSVVTSVAITVLVIGISMSCGYAISQIRFPGRRVIYFTILASFMVPVQALVVTHFVLMNDFGLVNKWGGIILPQLIAPVVVLVYKQFFDQVPKEMREAAVMDGAGHFGLLFRIFLPMNWGVTTALAIITFIAAWNAFFWPFLVISSEPNMTVTVGIRQVHDAFGVQYARNLAVAVLAGLPVAVAYLIFQRRVTEAIMLTSGIKG
jgi:multiple sugar transport system permease protein